MFLFWDRNIAVATLTVLGMLTIITSLFSYATIFIKLRLHQATVHPTLQCNDHHGQPVGEGIPALNIAQCKTTVTSIALVQSALVICYIPVVILNAILLLNNVLTNNTTFNIASNEGLTQKGVLYLFTMNLLTLDGDLWRNCLICLEKSFFNQTSIC